MEPPGVAWKCSVCGYVHRGPEPPDCCPVCGASRDEFERYVEAAPVAPSGAAQWKCLNCNYVHAGAAPPEDCPVCGARADRFEPLSKEVTSPHAVGRKSKIVIIGGGIAGVSALESICETESEITLISKEAEAPYYRLNLTRYLAGEVDRGALPIHPEDWYAGQGVTLRLGAEVAAIDLEGHQVRLGDGTKESYEKLVITAGAHPFVPPLTGASREGVMSLRSVLDADAMIERVAPGTRCVCVGGGILGLETAGGLARRGAEVTVLEGFGWLLPRQLNQAAGLRLERYVSKLGIAVKTSVNVQEIVGDERVRGVRIEDGAVLDADLVVLTTGVRPNSYLARLAGLEVNKGIVVDNHLRTSHPDVFAAGDVAEHRGVLYGTWSPARYQGAIAGMNAAGATTEFGGIPRSNTLKVLGLDLFSIGVVEPEDASFTVFCAEGEETYFRLLFRDSYLVGAILLGDASLTASVKKAVETKTDFSGLLEQRPSA